jgi:uncharacterized membrane protein
MISIIVIIIVTAIMAPAIILAWREYQTMKHVSEEYNEIDARLKRITK